MVLIRWYSFMVKWRILYWVYHITIYPPVISLMDGKSLSYSAMNFPAINPHFVCGCPMIFPGFVMISPDFPMDFLRDGGRRPAIKHNAAPSGRKLRMIATLTRHGFSVTGRQWLVASAIGNDQCMLGIGNTSVDGFIYCSGLTMWTDLLRIITLTRHSEHIY